MSFILGRQDSLKKSKKQVVGLRNPCLQQSTGMVFFLHLTSYENLDCSDVCSSPSFLPIPAANDHSGLKAYELRYPRWYCISTLYFKSVYHGQIWVGDNTTRLCFIESLRQSVSYLTELVLSVWIINVRTSSLSQWVIKTLHILIIRQSIKNM